MWHNYLLLSYTLHNVATHSAKYWPFSLLHNTLYLPTQYFKTPYTIINCNNTIQYLQPMQKVYLNYDIHMPT